MAHESVQIRTDIMYVCTTCYKKLDLTNSIPCMSCKKHCHPLHGTCFVSFFISKDMMEIALKIYPEKMFRTTNEWTPLLQLCIPCHNKYLEDFFKKIPPSDLPLYINFPWENIGGNLLYKRLLAGENSFK